MPYLLKLTCRLFVILLFVVNISLAAYGDTEAQKSELTVLVEQLAPCVMLADGEYTGFDIDLWEAIAKDLGWRFRYQETDLQGILSHLSANSADIGFSCITINEEREKTTDFSHHYFDSGLRILVLNKDNIRLFETLKTIFSPIVLKALFWHWFSYMGLDKAQEMRQ